MKRGMLSSLVMVGGIVSMLGVAHGASPELLADPSLDGVAYGESEGRISYTLTPLAPLIITGRGERERAAALAKLREGSGTTYIDEILLARDSSISRWQVRTQPLRVWIQPTADIDDFTAEHPSLVRTAFAQWDSAGLGGLHFRFVPDSARADVHVTWTDRFKEPISGRTRWARDKEWWITTANIVIAVHHHAGETLDPESTRAMTLHEVGHLLGLDHTSDETSVMAPRVRVRALSERDRATVQLMYSLPPGAVR
jgi:hypothetical protein